MAENFLEHFSSENRKLEGDDLPLIAALRNGKELDLRASVRHKDGHPVKVHVRAVPLRDEFGKLVGAAEFFEATGISPPPPKRMRARMKPQHPKSLQSKQTFSKSTTNRRCGTVL